MENQFEDVQSIHRTVRDLAALATLPATWNSAHLLEAVESLADLVLDRIRPDFLYLRIHDRFAGTEKEVTRTLLRPGSDEVTRRLGQALNPWLGETYTDSNRSVPDPWGSGQSQIVVEANTAGEALDSLTSTHTALRRHLFNDQNTLRNFVNIYLNDEDIRHASGPATPVKDGDTIMIVPSIAGGATVESEVGQELPELSNEEIMRYSRHLIMPEVGMEGQKRLKASSILLIGAGGLGSPLGLYLAAAGVGRLGLVVFH